MVILDDFSNSSPQVVDRIAEIAGRRPALVEGDSGNRDTLRRLLAQYPVDATIHFAGFKAVGESVAKPLAYYGNNVSGTVVLLECLEEAGARRLVFSSSATVYGDPASVPIREDFPTGPTNPYGRTKWHIEHMLNDLAVALSEWSIGILRYFNPVGAHASGRIGENPRGIPNNLMPFVTQVAVGKRPKLSVFGGDYPTHDGTGVRDYIHVVDLALGHLAALEKVVAGKGAWTVNLGTGKGYSVLDFVKAFEKASGKPIPYQIVDRRPGDVAQCYADPSLAAEMLGWRAQRDLQQMCADSWNWQQKNPDGY